ncbi:phosphatidate cytidylyltransferase, mitochondrial [Copidosoma floridanum]|uniref:phosphatidate cytidylyltransferase, mitochondrial n=1 Tax=Copidosoma floridanum TaxID=29053 RepID=UPI0006C9C27A|nr:phosphatidate cytidylyltransferase, mitochondrial [Copidosoma floridanum]
MAQLSLFKSILQDFPKSTKFCFAYGSGVFKQLNEPTKNMLDLIFVVRNPYQWHTENLIKNPNHYAQPLKLLGPKAIAKVQESGGARVYYNTLIQTSKGREIKYGIVSEISLVEDLLDWNMLYLAGRLHKPVQIIMEPDENSQLKTALVQNLHSAMHAALLLLPEYFTEIQLYKTITSLSYNGDFRMFFGEDKNKISNIVVSQMTEFRELYAPILKHFAQYIDISTNGNGRKTCSQDLSIQTKIYHLHHLPRTPQVKLVRAWSQGPRSKDTEDCFRAIAHDPDSSEIFYHCLTDIVRKSSVSQSFKGILTAGVGKAIKYSGGKIIKMMRSTMQKKQLSLVISAAEDKKEILRPELKIERQRSTSGIKKN